jgi:hypothetical protein
MQTVSSTEDRAMDNGTLTAIIASTAAMGGSIGGVLTGDILAARREQRQWIRRRADQAHAARFAAYEQLLRTAMLTSRATTLMRNKAKGHATSYPAAGLPDPMGELTDLRHAIRNVVLAGAPRHVTDAAYEVVKAANAALHALATDHVSDESFKKLESLSADLPHVLRTDLAQLVEPSDAARLWPERMGDAGLSR